MKYTERQRAYGVNSRLKNIMDGPSPDYPSARKNGRIVAEINGVKTVVDLIPYLRNVTQWTVFINGVLWRDHVGMNKVYKRLAELNPPASNK